VALTFYRQFKKHSPAMAPAAAATVAATPGPAAPVARLPSPRGNLCLVRMIDGVDSSKNHVGDVFHASLETDLTVGNSVVGAEGAPMFMGAGRG